MSYRYFSFLSLLCILQNGIAQGQSGLPSDIPFQGYLTDPSGVPLADGNYNLVFRLYTVPSGGSAVWLETRSGGNAVPVENGVFSVSLGSVQDLSHLVFDRPYYLSIQVGADPEMPQRVPLLPVPYAKAIPNVYPDGDVVNVTGSLSVGTTDNRSRFTLRGPDDRENGPVQFLFGDDSDQFESGRIRFVEATGSANWRGAFMHYNGSSNALHIGVHPFGDSLRSNDINVITVERSSAGEVGIGTESPNRELTVNDMDSDNDAFINVKSQGKEIDIGIAPTGYGRVSVQTNDDLRLRTNSSTRVIVRADGDTEILDDLEVTGEIRTDNTGNAMMVPRAYGAVLGNGTLSSNSGNVAVTRTGAGVYELDPDFCAQNSVVVATLNPPFSGETPGMIMVETDVCNPVVRTYELGVVTALSDYRFSFVIYNP